MKDEKLEKIRKLLEGYSNDSESLGLAGIAEIKEKDPETGEVVSEQMVNNTVVGDGGLEFVAQAILDAGVTDDWNFIAIGSDGTAEDEDDNSLIAFEEANNVSGDKQLREHNGYNAVVQFGPTTFEAGVGKSSIEETAVQDSDAGDGSETIFNRMTFDSINNEDNDLEITIYIDVGARGYEP